MNQFYGLVLSIFDFIFQRSYKSYYEIGGMGIDLCKNQIYIYSFLHNGMVDLE
ncbi:hypothetical protein [Clostridium moutaii]|uniref:hypothetical protein n=1 Tax=Clostridium moutaii TaxID=3240932 RepID=UPI00350E98DE